MERKLNGIFERGNQAAGNRFRVGHAWVQLVVIVVIVCRSRRTKAQSGYVSSPPPKPLM